MEGKEDIALHKVKFGYWEAEAPHLQPGDKYWFVINGKDKLPDPASLAQPQGVHRASQCLDLRSVRDTSYVPGWKTPELKNLIIYELHVGTFTPQGTFTALSEKLEYLKNLGINAIKIMPVAAFPGNRNWGYDGVYPFAVHSEYGGAMGLAQLVKSCHEHGIAVILDVVYNHLGPEGNYFNAYGPYFTGKYKTPWGKAINFDDACCDGVRQYFLENALMWLRDFHIDGLRLDAVQAIKDLSPVHFLQELSLQVQKLNKEVQRAHFLIGECDLNDTRFINPANTCGYGLDAQWCDEWHHALHALLTGEKNGYYADFGSIDHLCKSFNHAWVYDGSYSHHRKKYFGTSTVGQPGHKFVVFTQNHDQAGNRLNGERLSSLLDFESLKLAAGAMLLSPFVPMLFMGEEYAEENPFLYFIGHSDPKLVEAVRKGRKREYRDFMKNAEPPDPASKKTFEQSRLQWNFQSIPKKSTLWHYYKTLIAIRKDNPLLHAGPRAHTRANLTKDKKGIVLTRSAKSQWIITVFNFGDTNLEQTLALKPKTQVQVHIYSAHQKWGGTISNQVSPVQISQNTLKVSITKKSLVSLHLHGLEQ